MSKLTTASKFSRTILRSLLGIGAVFACSACNESTGTQEFVSTGIDLSSAVSHSTPGYGVCYEAALAEAWDFNVFVLGDITLPSADAEGRMAVGGNAWIGNYSIGAALEADATRKDLIVAGDLTFPSGAVLNGKAIYGGNASLTDAATAFGGFSQQASPLNFTNVGNYLKSMSTSLAALAPNSTVALDNHGSRHESNLSGSDSVINVFSMSTDDLERSDSLNLTIPSTATALINVSGTSLTLANFAMFLHGTDSRRVVFNFPDVTSMYIVDIAIEGTILAPNAAVTFASGQLNGHFIAASLYGQGQFNDTEFTGCLPYGVPDPTPSPSVTPSPTPSPSVTPSPDGGCTYTIGYWKNHKSAITPHLPQFLGTSGGASTFTVVSTAMAVDVLAQNVYGSPSNGITKLYAQLLAAKLNVSQGAGNSVIASAEAASDIFLSTHAVSSWSSLSGTDQDQVLAWKDAMDSFNNGITGPGHCAE